MRSSIDLLGTPQGEVEPVIPIQDRIVDATFTSRWPPSTARSPSGGSPASTLEAPQPTPTAGHRRPNGNPLFPQIKAYIDHILTAVDADTKFGQFAAADLNQYVERARGPHQAPRRDHPDAAALPARVAREPLG
jgi:hypothetical protein